MSANRIIRRRAWLATNPLTVDERGQLRRKASYHTHQIKVWQRHAAFQFALRNARLELGLPPTSSDMHNLHGRRI